MSAKPEKSFQMPLAVPKRRAIGEPKELLELVDQAQSSQILTATNLDQYLVELEASVVSNANDRMLHSDKPEKFFDSEMLLYEQLVRVSAAATDIALLERMSSERFIKVLLPLLGHPNDDVANVVVGFLSEVTDTEVDRLGDAPMIYAFVMLLVNGKIFGILLEKVMELEQNQDTKRDSFISYLELVENLMFWCEPASNPTEALVEGWSIWLMNGMSVFSKDIILRGYCIELLAELVTLVGEAREYLLGNGAIQFIVDILNDLRTCDDHEGIDEFMVNVVDVLSVFLLDEEGQLQFIKADGLEICFLMIKENKFAKSLATQILAFAISEPLGKTTSVEFIERGGLKYIFPLFMGSGNAEYQLRYSRSNMAKSEEYVCGVLESLFRFVDRSLPVYQRLVAKFSENDGEKTKRLVSILQQCIKGMEGAKTEDEESTNEPRAVCLTSCCLIAVHLLESENKVVRPLIQPMIPSIRNILTEEFWTGMSEALYEYRDRLSAILRLS